MSSSRQLAAIMFTDIVGYTALMGSDEQKAFEILKKNREIHQPIIDTFKGKLIKELGDGILASFPTVSDALFAAIKIQQACSASKELSLRIGIHEGEIIFENNDIYGDVVNIASRIQTLGVPGSILFSKKIADEIKNKAEFHTVSLGSFEFKNVNGSIEVFALANEGFPVPKRSMMEGKLKKKNFLKRNVIVALLFIMTGVAAFFIYKNILKKNDKAEIIGKSIAVLPFVNMSNDPEQEYFSDGITEDIITQVSKISDLKVISRTAVMQYKATKKTVQEIGKELNVATILEGSVRRAGNQVRIVAQLINTKTNEHLWAETYDKELTQIFAIQSKVAEQIASALIVKFTPPNEEQLERKLTESPAAYDFYLRGKFYFNENNSPGNDTAIIIFEQAVTEDPKFALAYAALTRAYTEKFFSYAPQEKWREQAFVALEKALSLDPGLPEAHLARARLIWIPENHFPHEQAVADVKQALSLRPNFVEARRFLSSIYSHIGLHEKALEEVQKALELNPHDPETLSQLSYQFYYQQKYTEMLAVIENLPKDFGGSLAAGRIAEVLLRMGQVDEAEKRVDELLHKFPDNANTNSVAAILFAFLGKKEVSEQKIEIAIKQGKNLGHFHHPAYNIGVAYALMNKHPEAIRWLKLTAEEGLPCYTLFANDPYLNNLRSDAEFKSLLETLKKQWEHFKATL
ncbi:MAG: tetratricopeptide repeat protein [Chitinophagaceae bacterium]|nr:MAG: tetratricopeptide repeat protein [Chitinophagaceae bacterium]